MTTQKMTELLKEINAGPSLSLEVMTAHAEKLEAEIDQLKAQRAELTEEVLRLQRQVVSA